MGVWLPTENNSSWIFMNEMSALYYFQWERQSEGGKERKGEGRGGENEREQRETKRDSNMTSHERIWFQK